MTVASPEEAGGRPGAPTDGWGGFFHAFAYAAHGFWWAYRHERNLRVHTVMSVLALAAGLLEGIAEARMVLLVILIVVVVALELVNTAVEAVTDLAHPAHHPLAGLAKDLAAGAVLWAAAGALAVGVVLLAPGLGRLPIRIGLWAQRDPVGLITLAAAVAAVVVAALVVPFPAEEARGD